MLKRLGTAVVIALLLCAGTSCSNGDDGPHLSKAEFVRAAKPICDATRQKLQEQSTKVALTGDNTTALPIFITFLSEEMLAQVQKLRDLGLPKADEDELDEALDTYEKTFKSWQKDPEDAASKGNPKDLDAAGKTFADYGLPTCGTEAK